MVCCRNKSLRMAGVGRFRVNHDPSATKATAENRDRLKARDLQSMRGHYARRTASGSSPPSGPARRSDLSVNAPEKTDLEIGTRISCGHRRTLVSRQSRSSALGRYCHGRGQLRSLRQGSTQHALYEEGRHDYPLLRLNNEGRGWHKAGPEFTGACFSLMVNIYS